MPDIEECFHTIVREAGQEGGREGGGRLIRKSAEKCSWKKKKNLTEEEELSRGPFKESIFLRDKKKKTKIALAM